MASKSIHLREAIQREKNMAAIAALDHHIGEWQVQLSGLQSTRNNLVRIARLPDEILAVIFLFVAAGTHCVTKWARVTWVCRRWRNAALRCPELWSQLNDSTPHPWIDVMVSRSQKALLSVRIDHYHRERSRIPRSKLRKVLKQTDRLQRVFLSCHPDDLPVLFKSLGSPAPRLESVTVKSAVHCLSIPASFNIPP
ncbi:hypothetical protein CC2G_009943 [Coprinopsis cinerea AmutBmut pab1-1]|nr:hypothetical protein CC2G_009943 [Coprinopsis cinerea AmutBmut pab1-1]